ncbi:MAG: hypothetical protein DWI25_03885 [Planctomycetota bacterium]|nr:MAG: hypothetical protein DWI25_03885 [Planctomycetota bacterium]
MILYASIFAPCTSPLPRALADFPLPFLGQPAADCTDLPSGPLAWPLVHTPLGLPSRSGLFDSSPHNLTSVDEPDEDTADEEDIVVPPPAIEEEAGFEDFDDDFDDDFEEDETDPDWDHPEDAKPELPPPGKGGGRKK